MTSAKKLLAAGAVLATLGIAGTAAAQNYYVVNDGYYSNGYYRTWAPPPPPSPYRYSYAPGYGYYPTYYEPPAYTYPGTLGVRLGPFFVGF
jgi:hypothetical protein